MGFVYNEGAESLLDGTINWGSDTIKARLFLTSDTGNKDSTSMTGLGVTGNDQTLGSKTRTKDDTNDRIVYDSADITFASQTSGAEVDSMIIFKFNTNDAGSTPIALIDITPVTPNGGDIVITVSSDGLFRTQQ